MWSAELFRLYQRSAAQYLDKTLSFWPKSLHCSLCLLDGSCREESHKNWVSQVPEQVVSWSKNWHTSLQSGCCSRASFLLAAQRGPSASREIAAVGQCCSSVPTVSAACSRWALSRCQVGQLETSLCQVNPEMERSSCFLGSSCCQRSENQARMKSRAWPAI